MTVEEVSEYLRICRASVYRLVKRNKIPVSRVGKRLRFRKETIDEWLTDMERNNHDFG
jgi:excisionase family DNA binding protein